MCTTLKTLLWIQYLVNISPYMTTKVTFHSSVKAMGKHWPFLETVQSTSLTYSNQLQIQY